MGGGQDRMVPDPIVQEICRLWGEKLIPIAPDLAAGRELSCFTSSFLTDVGLPDECPYQWAFYQAERLLEPITVAGSDYLLLGGDLPYEMWGVKVGAEDVWSLDPGGGRSAVFMNSRASDLVRFLGLYVSLYTSRPGLDEISNGDAQVIVDELRAQFELRDARALEETGYWWSLVLEQVSDGLL